ncbi:MAG: Rrf2 family transcriptional regulator [Nitrospinae bacterium]|nr:Rrf2 family transcriptional regulator [Nitrospinota bacterium]
MKISTRGHYAVQALVDMALNSGGAPTPLSVIAERQELSQNYLEQLFVKLRKAGLVRSVRGPGGGYLLDRPQELITIGDIFSAVEETLIITDCADKASAGSGQPCARASECRTQTLWARLCQHFNELLFAITLDDVAQGRIDLPATTATGKHAL